MSVNDPYFMRGERLGFRQWTPEDVRPAIAIWANPVVTRLIADLGDPSESQARERLARELAIGQEYRVQYWPIFLLETGENVGCCGLRPYRPEEGSFEIGAHILPDFWGGGFATEAMSRVVAH